MWSFPYLPHAFFLFFLFFSSVSGAGGRKGTSPPGQPTLARLAWASRHLTSMPFWVWWFYFFFVCFLCGCCSLSLPICFVSSAALGPGQELICRSRPYSPCPAETPRALGCRPQHAPAMLENSLPFELPSSYSMIK